MNNMEIYEKVKAVPEEAKKPITGGRLKGLTDIKPMWRIEMLTKTFGPCGIGWKTKTINKEIIEGANGEKIAVVDIELYIKVDGEWSDAIEGTGGSSFISKEKNGYYTSDECYKMAYTDALSVACKSLGIGADVYWGSNVKDTKYSRTTDEETQQKPQQSYKPAKITPEEAKTIYELMVRKGFNVIDALQQAYRISNTSELTKAQYRDIERTCKNLPDKK